MAKPTWRKYEEQILEEVRKWAGPDAKIEFDVKMPGKISGGVRQIDILVTADFAGGMLKDRTAAIDCKCYGKKINITHADKFVGLIDDVQTDFGILITNKGWSKRAEERLPSRLSVLLVEDEPAMALALIYALPEPMWPVEFGEEHYTGEFWGDEPRGGFGALITYHYVERLSRRPIDHPEELEWLEEVVATDAIDALNWSDEPDRRHAAEVVLRHYLSREPSREELDAFMLDVASEWEDGKEWYIEVAEIRTRTGLWPEIATA
jgi:hypothetical protein